MITVCIATYNGERFVGEQIASILPQLAADDEIVLSDDGSTDKTLDIVRSFADRRIRIIDGPHRHSPTLNFERALREAKGDYIFLADQDDVWLPNKVEVCLNALQHCACVISDARVTDSQLRVTASSLYAILHINRSRLSNLLWRNGYTGCCMAFRSEGLRTALPFPSDIPMHDIWLGNVAAFCHSLRFIDEPLVLFRRHRAAASCNGKGSHFSLWQKLGFRWHTLKNIIVRKQSTKTYHSHDAEHHHSDIQRG